MPGQFGKRKPELRTRLMPGYSLDDLLSRAVKVGECLELQGTTNQKGYTRVQYEGRSKPGHRVAYILAKGPVPDGLVVMHSCDNRRCINPDHLSVGTNLDNTRDCVAKGRFNAHKPPEYDYTPIIADYRSGLSLGALSKKYGPRKSTIHAYFQRNGITRS